jgi:hypothetical protein
MLQAGGKWAQDETSRCKQATQHDSHLTGQMVTDNTPKWSFKKIINRFNRKALRVLWKDSGVVLAE